MVIMRRIKLHLLTLAVALSLVIAISLVQKRTSVHLTMPTTTPYLYTLTQAGHKPVLGDITSIPEVIMKTTKADMVSATMEDAAYNWEELASPTGETASEGQMSATEMVYPWEEQSSTTRETPFTTEGPISKSTYPWENSLTTEEMEQSTTEVTSTLTTELLTTLTEAPTTMNALTTMIEALPTTNSTSTSKVLASPKTTSAILTEGHATAITWSTTGTQAPSTTKMASSTMAAGPTPPELVVGEYTIAKADGTLCVKAEMALQIRVTYHTMFKNESEGIFTVQPSRTVAVGGCGETTATLHLKFEEGVVFFRFQKNTTTNTVYVSTVAFLVTYPFPNSDPKRRTFTAKNESVQLFSAQLSHSYTCSQQSISMGQKLYLEVSHQRIQALDFTEPAFGPEDPCPVDQENNLALILGILLLVLIVAVAVACFIWRRKKLEGYQPL